MRKLAKLALAVLLVAAAVPVTAKRSSHHNHHGDANTVNASGRNTVSKGNVPLNVTAVSGVPVDLKCRIKLQECGNFYSVAWYRQELVQAAAEPQRGTMGATAGVAPLASQTRSATKQERVYVYMHNNGLAKAEGPWRGRAQHVYDSKRHVMKVRLSDSRLSDESHYKCEVTYEERGRWFKETCLHQQLTRLTMMEAPSGVRLEVEVNGEVTGEEVLDGQKIGPFNEGALLSLKCTAEGGKPVPKITWWNGDKVVPSSFYEQLSRGDTRSGNGSVASHATLVLSRAHLGARLACKVSSAAMDAPAVVSTNVDMNLAPSALEMHSPQLLSHQRPATHSLPLPNDGGVAEGGKMTVTCVARGAKPAAYIYWNSEPEMDLSDTMEEVTQHGLTFDTLNRLTFKAERRLTSLACFASNEVLDQEKGMHLSQATTVNVKYAPEIKVEGGVGPERLRLSVQVDSLILHCRYEANPATGASVTWYLDGEELGFGSDSPFERGSADSAVLRSRGKVDKRAEGTYSCEVENQIGRSKRTEIARVAVEEKPRVVLSIDPPVAVGDKNKKKQYHHHHGGRHHRAGVSELLNANVTLSCLPAEEGGERFAAVKWYLGGLLLKVVGLAKECFEGVETGLDALDDEEEGEVVEWLEGCKMDPTKIRLENVKRFFGGNYSCRGRGLRGGWGAESKPTELKVLYPPSGAALRHKPPVVHKGMSFQLECSASDDPGFPPATRASWTHDGKSIPEVSSLTLRVAEAGAVSAGNYTCTPRNEAGDAVVSGDSSESAVASVNVEVHTAPRFVKRLPRYSGAPFNRRIFRLTCKVECDPVCSLSWLRNGQKIETDGDGEDGDSMDYDDGLYDEAPASSGSLFRVRKSVWPPDASANRLLSVESTLEVDVVAASSGVAAGTSMEGDNYTCASTSNSVGPGVRSTTQFKIHYPPRNITVGLRTRTVPEKSQPKPFGCFADAYPPAQYYWHFEGPVGKIVSGDGFPDAKEDESDDDDKGLAANASVTAGALRQFRHPVSRRQAGVYTCTAYNDLGNLKASLTLKVTHPPSCRLRKEYKKVEGSSGAEAGVADPFDLGDLGGAGRQRREQQRLVLRCHVTEAEPFENVTFFWYHDGRLVAGSAGPVLTLEGGAEGSYACEAQNAAGAGDRCGIKVTPRPLAAQVADTGYSTYLIFGGAAVACALAGFGFAAFLCRRLAFGKYDFSYGAGGGAGGTSAATRNTTTTSHNNNDRAAINNGGGQAATTAASAPKQHQGILKQAGSNGQANHIVQEDSLYVTGAGSPPLMRRMNGGGRACSVSPPIVPHHVNYGSNGGQPSLLNGHASGGGGYATATRVKRVTLNEGRTSIEESCIEDESTTFEEDSVLDADPYLGINRPVPPVYHGGYGSGGRDHHYHRDYRGGPSTGGRPARAPRELWLV